MHRLLHLVFVLTLALGLISPAYAAGGDEGDSPETARSLSLAASDELAGDVAGSFHYYSIDYGDHGRLGKLTINATSLLDPGAAEAFGVNLWKDGSLVATGSALGSSPTAGLSPGANAILFAAPTAGPILVQVYNYNHGVDVPYDLSLAWVDPAAEAADGSTSTLAARSEGPLGGMLTGNSGGSSANHELWSTGDGSIQAVALTFAPAGADLGSAVFLHLYQNGNLIASGKGSEVVSGVLTVQFGAVAAGPVLAQVVNYNDGASISYTLSQSQVVIVASESGGEGGEEE